MEHKTYIEEKFDLISHCARCSKKFCNGKVTQKGKHYPAFTVKKEDGTIEEIQETDEVKEALCVECLKETYDSRQNLHDLLNKINEWAEENKVAGGNYNCGEEGCCPKPEEGSKEENDFQWQIGYNQALSDLQTYLASLGK